MKTTLITEGTFKPMDKTPNNTTTAAIAEARDKIKAQKPAEGILKTNEWGDSKWYHVRCDCGSDDCSHEINVEVDDIHVQVHIYSNHHTKWWEKKRWAQIWQILTQGYADMQTTIVLNEQVALNYAETLKSAMKDVKDFRDERIKKKST